MMQNSEKSFSIQEVDKDAEEDDDGEVHGDSKIDSFKDLETIYTRNGKRNGYLSPYDKKTIREIQKVFNIETLFQFATAFVKLNKKLFKNCSHGILHV